MRSTFFRTAGLALLSLAVIVLSLGCAQQRAPINRVQALALSKHFFVGPNLSDPSDDPEFYMGSRIIDQGFGVGQDLALFQALGSFARIRFEIQESVLIARLTYDRIQNTGGGNTWGATKTNNGQVVAEFTIQSHFDIIRDYNTQTGEQLNVTVENTTDRPWYEREYMRVDWSKNLVTDAYDFDVLADAALQGVRFDSLSYYIEDPADPNAPVYSETDGYIDVTTKVFATPQTIDTPFGTYPACAIFSGSFTGGQAPAVTCNPSEITLRLAFKKVVDDDYEPEDWTGPKMSAFGWFTQDRYGYDRNYGIVDQRWHRFAAKYNVWKASHVPGAQCAVDSWRDANGNVATYRVENGQFVADPATGLPVPDPKGQPFTRSVPGVDVHRDENGNGTEDECEFGDANGVVQNAGSRCDEFTHKCDLPLYKRETKTIPFYFGPTAPPDLFPSTAAALGQWNLAVKRSVQLGKQVESTRVHLAPPAGLLTTEADLAADEVGKKTVPDIFVLCHNPVSMNDDPACDPRACTNLSSDPKNCSNSGLTVRLGDLRYNLVDIIQNPQYPTPWGVMSDFNDPLTGEKVQASINEWGAVLDQQTQNVDDILRWIDGEISNTQISNGQYMQSWLTADKLASGRYMPKVLSQAEAKSRSQSLDRSNALLNGLVAGQTLASAMATAPQALAAAQGPSLDSDLEAGKKQVLWSDCEAQLITPNYRQMAGLDPRQSIAGDNAAISMASPLQELDPRMRRWARQTTARALASRNACMLDEAPEPDALVGLARQAQTLFPLPSTNDPSFPAKLYTHDQALHQWLREQFHLAVIAHEMGHSMGLRHNFAGSFDSLNYHTEYWQIRTRNGQEHYCGYPGPLDASTPHTNGADCVGPRWVDPVTDQEQNDLLWKWGSSTVMDYPGDQTQDTNDIGPYDKAAMRFGYADIVDVEPNMTVAVGKTGMTTSPPATGGAGTGYDFVGAFGLLDGWGGIIGFPYGTTFQTQIGMPNGQGNHYSTYADKYGLLGPGCGQVKRPGYTGDPKSALAYACSGPDFHHAAERDMRTIPKFSVADAAQSPQNVVNFGVDATGHVRHPYMFGGDEFADVGNVPVFRFDAGADPYEQASFLVSTYENRYVFNNFRRNRVTFSTWQAVNNIESRYWDKIQGLAKTLAFGIEILSTPNGTDPTTLPALLQPHALGAAVGFDMFIRALTRPEPGLYATAPAIPGGPPNTWGGVQNVALANANPPPATIFNVSLGNGQGRFVQNDFDYTQGYNFSDYQTQAGSYYEKVRAPIYLTEAYNNFISNTKEDYIDGRYKNLSYLSLYPQQVRRLVANLMATQSATPELDQGAAAQIFTVAPYVVPGNKGLGGQSETDDVQYLPWGLYDPTDPGTLQLQYPPGAVLLDPLVGWEQQYPMLFHLFRYGKTSLSLDFVDQVRIFNPGDPGSASIAPNQTVAFRDPLSGIEYTAHSYGTEWVNPAVGYEVEKGIAARMIQHANHLAAIAYQVTAPPDPVTGELTYDHDPQGSAIPVSTQIGVDAAAMLKGYVSNLDYARKLAGCFGYLSPYKP
jgi:hypothetical protein